MKCWNTKILSASFFGERRKDGGESVMLITEKLIMISNLFQSNTIKLFIHFRLRFDSFSSLQLLTTPRKVPLKNINSIEEIIIINLSIWLDNFRLCFHLSPLELRRWKEFVICPNAIWESSSFPQPPKKNSSWHRRWLWEDEWRFDAEKLLIKKLSFVVLTPTRPRCWWCSLIFALCWQIVFFSRLSDDELGRDGELEIEDVCVLQWTRLSFLFFRRKIDTMYTGRFSRQWINEHQNDFPFYSLPTDERVVCVLSIGRQMSSPCAPLKYQKS